MFAGNLWRIDPAVPKEYQKLSEGWNNTIAACASGTLCNFVINYSKIIAWAAVTTTALAITTAAMNDSDGYKH